jgi:hypothetical protein
VRQRKGQALIHIRAWPQLVNRNRDLNVSRSLNTHPTKGMKVGTQDEPLNYERNIHREFYRGFLAE